MKFIAIFLFLTVSNIIMTFAWYWHIKPSHSQVPLWQMVLISWGLAFFDYCIIIPTNHQGAIWGIKPFQLKIVQEVITLLVFTGFALLYLREEFRWNYLLSFFCILGAVYFAFKKA